MPLTPQQLADPQLISQIARLQVRARQVVEGVISGLHRSPYHGFSVEFAQHREYTPGDEIRYVDWKVAGRSDRYYIKEFEEETNLKAYLMVDASESMTYRGRRPEWSKREYPGGAAPAPSSLRIQQRAAGGLGVFDDATRSYLPPRGLPSHFMQILQELCQTTTRPKTNLGNTFHELA